MYLVLRRLPARLCRGICHSSPSLSAKQSSGIVYRTVSFSSLQGKCLARSRPWLRPSTTVLAQTSTQVLQQYGSLHSSVATWSSLRSPADLCAAIADASTHAALQSLAATAASIPQQSWLAQEYKVQLLASLDQQAPASLAKSLLFYAKLGPGHVDLFQAAVPVIYNQLGQLSPQDLLRVLMAFAVAAQHSPAAYSQELFAAATEFLWENLGQLEPCALADVAAAYAAVQHYDDDEDFFEGLAASALQQIQGFCPDDLSRLCHSLATLRFSAPALHMAAVQQMANQIEAWPLSCVGRLLYALAAVQSTPDPCLLDRVAGHVSVVLRNLRTSTDGQRVLASLGAKASAAAGGSKQGAGGGVLPGTDGSSSSSTSVGSGPTWQGFGMTRSSSGLSIGGASGIGSGGASLNMSAGIASIAAVADSASSSSSDGVVSFSSPEVMGVAGNNGSRNTAASSSSSSDGAASIWAAANRSIGNYEYTPEASEQDNPLGPDYIMVTSYGPDGKVTTTFVKRADAPSHGSSASSSRRVVSSSSSSTTAPKTSSTSTSSSGSSITGPGSSFLRGGLVLPPSNRGARAASTSSSPASGSSPSSSSRDSRASWARQPLQRDDECPAASWANSVPVAPDCRPVYDDAEALQAALVHLSWAFAMLGHLHSNMAKECFKALALVAPEAFGDEQLVMLWAAHLRYQQLGHVMLDPNPLLADSYSVFLKELSRAAPRTISLPLHLQPLAAANWLLHTVRQSPEYEQEHHEQQQFSSWKFRDPAVLTQRGLEASVRTALSHLGLPVGEPCITLDGVERVGLPLKHNGVAVAWQVVPPAWCTRNPPYTPTVEAQMHRWALQYRGYTVLQVPFHEWASVLESGDMVVQAGYLQNMLNGVSVRVPKMSNF